MEPKVRLSTNEQAPAAILLLKMKVEPCQTLDPTSRTHLYERGTPVSGIENW